VKTTVLAEKAHAGHLGVGKSPGAGFGFRSEGVIDDRNLCRSTLRADDF